METILLIVVLTSIIQSLFGVGVLLFGTPLLLLFDYTFIETLLILLPISATINLMQVISGYKNINFKIYSKVLLLTVPFIILFLFLVFKTNININLIVGLLLTFISLKNYIKPLQNIINKLMHYDKTFYILLGSIHGLTNLGGGLLTAKIFYEKLNKHQKIATIAISYLTFVLFQLITLFTLEINYNYANIIFIPIGVLVYLLTNKVFLKIEDNTYNILLGLFLFITGILLIFK